MGGVSVFVLTPMFGDLRNCSHCEMVCKNAGDKPCQPGHRLSASSAAGSLFALRCPLWMSPNGAIVRARSWMLRRITIWLSAAT